MSKSWLVALLVFSGLSGYAQTYYSRTNGPFNSPSTWSQVSHVGPASPDIPGNTGSVAIIGNGNTVTLTGNTGMAGSSVTIDPGATLNMAGFSLSLSGNFNVNGTVLNGGEIIAGFCNLQIYSSSSTIPVFTQLTINDGIGCGTITLYTDIVLTVGLNIIQGGYDDNGFHVYPCSPPTITSFSPVFDQRTTNSMRLSWTRGNGDQVLVVMRQFGVSEVKPSFGTSYTANAAFGSGSATGAGNFVVYKGTGTSVTITGLSGMYEFSLFEFNSAGLCYAIYNYQTASEQTCIAVPAPTGPQNASYCNGDSKPAIQVNSPGSGRNINWYDAATGGNQVTGDGTGGDGRGGVFIPDATGGTFYAEIYDGTFQCTSPTRTAVTLTLNPTLQPGSVGANQNLCGTGDPVALTQLTAPAGGDGTFNYQWTSASAIGGPYTNIGSATLATYDPPSTSATTYFQRKVSSPSCVNEVATNVVTVAVLAAPVISSDPSPAEVCAQDSFEFTVGATGSSLGYQWQVDNGAGFVNVTNTGVYSGATTSILAVSDATGLNGNQYRVIVTTSGSCPVTSAPALLTVNPRPTAAPQVQAFCEDNPGGGQTVVNLTLLNNAITGGAANRVVEWWLNSGLTTPVPTPTAFGAKNNDVIYATVTNTLTFCHSFTTVTYTITQKPVALPIPTTICSGASTNLTFTSSVPGTTYTWTVTPNASVTGASAASGTSLNQLLTNTTSAQQAVTYTVTPIAAGCSGTPFTQTVNVGGAMSAFTVTGGGLYCTNTSGVSVGLSGSETGITYELYRNAAATGSTVNGNNNAINFTPLITQTGVYTVKSKNTANCSRDMTGSVSVTIDSPPAGTPVLNGITTLCEGATQTYAVTGVTNATSYTWEVTGGLEITSQAATSASIKAAAAMDGSITVSGKNNCGAGSTASIQIDVIAAPFIEIILPTNAFVDDPVKFDYSSSSVIDTWEWSLGDGTTSGEEKPEHAYTAAQTYPITLTITDDRGCSDSDAKELVVKPEPGLTDKSIMNVITANGDTKNAFLYIDRIEKYPENEVALVDRWGVVVFQRKGYANDWDLKTGEEYLPAGNYVCIVKHDGNTYSRTITVIKSY